MFLNISAALIIPMSFIYDNVPLTSGVSPTPLSIMSIIIDIIFLTYVSAAALLSITSATNFFMYLNACRVARFWSPNTRLACA